MSIFKLEKRRVHDLCHVVWFLGGLLVFAFSLTVCSSPFLIWICWKYSYIYFQQHFWDVICVPQNSPILHWVCNSMIFIKYTEFCKHHQKPILVHFYYCIDNSCLLTINSSFYPSSRHPLICFLCLQICLFWIFQIKWLIIYVVFCLWFLLLNITFFNSSIL